MTDQLQNKPTVIISNNSNPPIVESTLEDPILTVQNPQKPKHMDATADSSILPVGKESEMTGQLQNIATFSSPSIDEPPLEESMTVHDAEMSENVDKDIFEQPFMPVAGKEKNRIDTHVPKNMLPSLDEIPENAAEQSVETNQMLENAVSEACYPNQPLERTNVNNKSKKSVSFEQGFFQIPESVGTLEPALEICSKDKVKKLFEEETAFLREKQETIKSEMKLDSSKSNSHLVFIEPIEGNAQNERKGRVLLKEAISDKPTTSEAQKATVPQSSRCPSISSTELSPHKPSLLQEALECLAQSNLIFLLANLRLLSATGRLFTKFETISIDSDFVGKYCAANLTGEVSESDIPRAWRGISPAQTMAVLLIELRKELISKRQNGQDNILSPTPSASTLFSDKAEVTLHSEEDSLFSTMVDPTGRKATTNDMDKALGASIAMIGRDLELRKPDISRLSLLETMRSFISRENTESSSIDLGKHIDSAKVSRFSTLFEGDETNENDGVKEAPKRQIFSTPSNLTPQTSTRRIRRQGSVPEVVGAYMQNFRERSQSVLQIASKNVGEKVPLLTEEAKHRQMLEHLVNDFFGVGTHSENTMRGSLLNRTLTEAELLDFMEKAVESRLYERLQFMADFFKDGTVSRALVQSKSKVVWLNDWYPLKDLTYAISIDEEKKRVMVVFRGAITSSDWGAATNYKLQKTANPVKDNFEGKQEFIKLHRGFFLYLFRRRKDTETCKYDEIASVVDRYGRQIADDNYEVFITGHSLGGALATVFSFYASTEERFTRSGPLKCITFGAPMVGSYAFADSFLYQERQGKLMLARFHNARDMGE